MNYRELKEKLEELTPEQLEQGIYGLGIDFFRDLTLAQTAGGQVFFVEEVIVDEEEEEDN